MTQYLNSTFDLNSDALMEVFDEMPYWSAPFGLKLLENIKYKKNISALDIGFGAGFPLTELALRLGDSCKVYGIDPWNTAIKRVKKKIDIYGIKNITILKEEIENCSLEDNSIDLITSNNGINNVSDLNKTIRECARIIRAGGQFVQSINLNDSMIEFYEIFEEVVVDMKMEGIKDKIHEHIYEKRKPLNEFVDLIENHGFKVENVVHDKFEYTFVDGTTMLNHYFMQLAFLPYWKDLVPKNNQKGVFRTIEERMNKKAEKEGCFKLNIPFVVIDSTNI